MNKKYIKCGALRGLPRTLRGQSMRPVRRTSYNEPLDSSSVRRSRGRAYCQPPTNCTTFHVCFTCFYSFFLFKSQPVTVSSCRGLVLAPRNCITFDVCFIYLFFICSWCVIYLSFNLLGWAAAGAWWQHPRTAPHSRAASWPWYSPIHICICIYVFIHIYIQICIFYIHTHTRTHTHTHTHIHARTHTHTHTHMYIHTYICNII